MKLKFDENNQVVVQDGKPVYVHDDGKEMAFDAPQALAKISALNGEAKQHREAKEAAEKKLAAFGDMDAEAAKKALETVKNLDDKKLIDAGEVERVKAEAKKAYDEQLAAANKERDDIKTQYHTAMISGEFARSSFIKDKTILPPDIMQAQFGKHFTVNEQGTIVATDANGNQIWSRTNPGSAASFDEAIEEIIGGYSHKDSILRGTNATGAGATQAGSTAPTKAFGELKTTAEKAAWLEAQTAN